jgi:hypothetical protein
MKKTIFITALAAILILSCKKKTTTTATNTTTPPPNITVNQLVFGINGGTTYTATTVSSLINNIIDIEGGPSSRNIQVDLRIPNSVGTYTLNGGSTNATYIIVDSNNVYRTDATHTGTVNITQYDSTNRKISGKFSFNALITSTTGTITPTISITNGSFTNVSF